MMFGWFVAKLEEGVAEYCQRFVAYPPALSLGSYFPDQKTYETIMQQLVFEIIPPYCAIIRFF